MLSDVKSEPVASRSRLAVLGMVPIVVLLVSWNVAPRVTSLLRLPEGLAVLVAVVLGAVGFFASRAILRRGSPRATEVWSLG